MKLLLVEDEYHTMEGILKSIDWNSLGIDTVLTADDGKKGLDIARKHSPEIVLADMYMPKMDGASMAKNIRRILPDCAFVFMSGYSDISYYKSAIQVSALEFVNKPLVIDELVEALEKTVKHVRDNTARNDCYFSYKSNELALYVINENADNKKLMNLWIDYGMPYGEEYLLHTMILKQADSENVFTKINELAHASGISVSVGSTENGYVIHAAVPIKEKTLLNTFSKDLLNQYSREATCLAVGKPVTNPLELRDSYSNAANLIKLSFFYPERRLFTYEDTAPSLVNEFDPVSEIAKILYYNPSRLKQWVECQFEKIRNNPGTPVEMVKYWGFRICTELYFHLDRLKEVNIHQYPANETELWGRISSLNTFDALRNLVFEIIDILDCSQMDDENSPIIRKVQRYIYNNLYKQISLKSLSEHVNFSVTYLCSLFKEKTGQTINSYIFDVRIHRAKLMLESTDMYINEIAAALGFSSSNYFIKAFRKATGVTPQEYRKEHGII